eukprot:3817405-Prorocentrum_lima.AAC.1
MLWACEITSNYCVEVGTNFVVSSSNHDDRHFRGSAAHFKDIIKDSFLAIIKAGLHEPTHVLILCNLPNVA